MHYGIPVNNLLVQNYDLTLAHYGEKLIGDDILFKQIILTPKKIGPFIYFKENIYKLCQKFDAVIVLSDLHILPYITLGLFSKRKFALTYYGIGVSASYNKKFDIDKRSDLIRFNLMKRADSNVFYSEYPIQRYVDAGIKRDSLFVAHNTIQITDKIEISHNKESFLFVGTLYKEKKIYDLLNAYYITYKKDKNLKSLIIIGNGTEKSNIEKWISESGIAHKIFLKGAIYDSTLLKSFYSDAIACISPGQAGLSVLSCFAYGVPFITTFDAITGGELFNIKNGVNGYLYSGEVSELADILILLNNDKEKVYELSKNAQEYYFNNRTLDMMVKGLSDAVNYALFNVCHDTK
ncbi:glycosyl transferase [Bacteroidia bacterium]|nr:glycosyl transferase [Bacteroidia bacterium]